MEVAVAAARAGGAVLIEGLQRPKQVELKSERSSIVTWADVTSQAAIFDVIGERVPPATRSSARKARRCCRIRSHLDRRSPRRHVELRPSGCRSRALGGADATPDGVVVGAIFEPFRGELFTATARAWCVAGRRSAPRGRWRGRGERLEVSTADSLAARSSHQASSPTTRHRSRPTDGGSVAPVICTTAPAPFGSPALCLAYVAGRPHRCVLRTRRHVCVGRRRRLVDDHAKPADAARTSTADPLNFGTGVANVLGSNGRHPRRSRRPDHRTDRPDHPVH